MGWGGCGFVHTQEQLHAMIKCLYRLVATIIGDHALTRRVMARVHASDGVVAAARARGSARVCRHNNLWGDPSTCLRPLFVRRLKCLRCLRGLRHDMYTPERATCKCSFVRVRIPPSSAYTSEVVDRIRESHTQISARGLESMVGSIVFA